MELEKENENLLNVFDKMHIKEIVDRIEAPTITISSMKDPIRLSTKVFIQFDCRDVGEFEFEKPQSRWI